MLSNMLHLAGWEILCRFIGPPALKNRRRARLAELLYLRFTMRLVIMSREANWFMNSPMSLPGKLILQHFAKGIHSGFCTIKAMLMANFMILDEFWVLS